MQVPEDGDICMRLADCGDSSSGNDVLDMSGAQAEIFMSCGPRVVWSVWRWLREH